jgi:glyoxylase-like metal-dependent hydrolase (beta-lactamase superfamily II)
MHTYRINDHLTVLNDHLEVPGIGFLPVNAFVLHAREPVVIDTGLGLPDRDFVAALRDVLDPAEVRWIWLSHPDRDHTGGLFDLLEAAPNALLVTTFLAVGIMSTERPVPLDRVYLLNPGQSLHVGDRTLHAFRPPLFDSPATVGFYDDKSRTSFSSDCFGAPLPSAELAASTDVREVSARDLRAAQLLWAAVDSPWVHNANTDAYLQTVRSMRATAPDLVLSTHLPPAHGLGPQLFDMLAEAPDTEPFVGPDQAALRHMLASFEPTAVLGAAAVA